MKFYDRLVMERRHLEKIAMQHMMKNMPPCATVESFIEIKNEERQNSNIINAIIFYLKEINDETYINIINKFIFGQENVNVTGVCKFVDNYFGEW